MRICHHQRTHVRGNKEPHAGGSSDSRQEGRLDFGGIEQLYTAVEKEESKLDIRCGLYEMVTVAPTVVFCNTRQEVEWLTDGMHCRGFAVSPLVCPA